MCASPHVFTLQTYFCVRCDNFFFEILSIRCIPVYEIIIHTCMTPDPSLSPPSLSLPYPQSELCLGTFMKSWGFAVHCLFQQISGWVNRQSQTLATIDSSPRISLSQLRPSPKWDQTQLIKLNDSSPPNERENAYGQVLCKGFNRK